MINCYHFIVSLSGVVEWIECIADRIGKAANDCTIVAIWRRGRIVRHLIKRYYNNFIASVYAFFILELNM